jgi:hypothetical protein
MRRRTSALRRRYGRAGYVSVAERYAKVPHKMPKGDAPPKSFTSPGGRAFKLGRAEHVKPRYKGDTFWSDTWPIFLNGKEAGAVWRNLTYGTTAEGKPKWSASLTKLVWSGPMPPTGLGFDVSGCDTAADCLAKFAHNADQVLDWREGKAVRSMYSKTGSYRREGT